MTQNALINELPPVGSIVLVPLANGMFSAAIIVKQAITGDPAELSVLAVSSAWVSSKPLLPPHDALHRWLFLTHHNWKSYLEASWISHPLPSSMTIIGLTALTEEEQTLDSVCYGTWNAIALQMLLQWRWDNDREAVLSEEATEKAKIDEQRHLYAEKQRDILRTTTWDSLLAREWFTEWDAAHETALRQNARILISTLITTLKTAPKITKTLVRRQLHDCVNAFNKLDEELGFPIKTTHCEDIINALELITIVAKQPTLIHEVDNWRNW